MKIKIAFVALALTCAPAMSFAMGCSHNKEQQAQSCAQGSVWDHETGSCVKQVTS